MPMLDEILGAERAAELDRFDRVQLADVIQICRQSRTLSEAGRRLFDVSRTRKTSSNDADRLRKYLARFGLNWEDCRPGTIPARTRLTDGGTLHTVR